MCYVKKRWTDEDLVNDNFLLADGIILTEKE